MTSAKNKTEKEWKKKLSKLEYDVLRLKGTERPFTGEFWDHKEKGIYKPYMSLYHVKFILTAICRKY